MSKCEACGGDGLIEVGAYRGDEHDPNTRECRLCGGPRPVLDIPAGTSIDKTVEALTALGYAGVTAKESISGVRRTVAVLATDDPPHVHQWKPPEKFGPYVRFGCHGCGKGLVFSRHGSLAEGEAPDPFVVSQLSRQAVVFAARDELNML